MQEIADFYRFGVHYAKVHEKIVFPHMPSSVVIFLDCEVFITTWIAMLKWFNQTTVSFCGASFYRELEGMKSGMVVDNNIRGISMAIVLQDSIHF